MSSTLCTCPHCGGEIILNVEAIKPLPFVHERYLVSIPKSLLIDDNLSGGLSPPINPVGFSFAYSEEAKKIFTREQAEKIRTKIYGPQNIPASEKENGTPTEGGGRVEGNTKAAPEGATSKLWLPNLAAGKEATQKTKEEGT